MKKELCTAFAFLLGACSSPTTMDYANYKPALDIRDYLSGPTEARGMIFVGDKADEPFYVKLNGTRKDNILTLDEDFTYADGRKEKRTWTLTFTDDHHFIGRAADVVGDAVGTQHGNAMNMQYTLNAQRPNGDTIQLSMDDWMYLLEDGKTIINHTKMRKYGITVGELILTFNKL